MLKEGRYTFGEIQSYLTESTGGEFKPRKGEKVDSENKKNNDKAVDDINSNVKSHIPKDAPKRHTDEEDVQDYNKTTLDVRMDYDPGKRYKERVRSQVNGYFSPENEDNSDADKSGADFGGNERFYNMQKKKNAKLNDIHAEIKHAGLKSRMLPKSYFENETLFDKGNEKNESRTMKRLHFKNTQFLSEAQMFSRVPDAYKFDGSTFIMRDATGTDYLIECKVDDEYGNTKMTVINKMNKKSVNEELDRMRELYGYKGEDKTCPNGDRKGMSEMLSEARRNLSQR